MWWIIGSAAIAFIASSMFALDNATRISFKENLFKD